MNGAMGAACHSVGSLVDTKGAGDEDSLIRLSQVRDEQIMIRTD